MQENTQNSTLKVNAPLSQAGKSESVIIQIPSYPRQDADVFERLRRSKFGCFYRKHLKRNPIFQASFIWIWRNVYPAYVKLFLISKAGKWKKLVRFSDYIKYSEQVLLDPSVFELPEPNVFPKEDRRFLIPSSTNITFPKIKLAVVHDALQYGGTNFVLVDERVICHDLYNFKLDSTSEELHGRIQIDTNADRIRFFMHDKAPASITEAASFVDACAGNYAHWMTEVLPRIALFCAEERFEKIPIIVNEGLHVNIMESLFMVAGERKIFVLPAIKALKIKKLYLTSVTGYVPFDRRNHKLGGHSEGIFSPEALRKLSRCLTGKIASNQDHQWPQNIYLRRNFGTRNVANQAELERILTAHGYTTIDTEKLTFAQQVQIFSKAKSIIGPTGAAFANAIFCRPGTKVTILMGKHKNMIYKYWLNMLAPLGISVNYILGNIVGNRHLGIHSDFEVAPTDVLTWLAEI